MTSLKELIKVIHKYQKDMGYDYANMPLEQKMQQMRNYSTALMVEQVELLQELPWKPWRPLEIQPVGSKRKILDEWVDCLVFLVDQTAVLEFSPEDIEEAVELTIKKIIDRLSSGYSSTKGKV